MNAADVKVGQTLYTVYLATAGYETHREPQLISIEIVKETATRFEVRGERAFMVLRGSRLYKNQREFEKFFLTPEMAWVSAKERMARKIEATREDLAFYEERAAQVEAAIVQLLPAPEAK